MRSARRKCAVWPVGCRPAASDLQLAEKLIMALVNGLPADSKIDVGIEES